MKKVALEKFNSLKELEDYLGLEGLNFPYPKHLPAPTKKIELVETFDWIEVAEQIGFIEDKADGTDYTYTYIVEYYNGKTYVKDMFDIAPLRPYEDDENTIYETKEIRDVFSQKDFKRGAEIYPDYHSFVVVYSYLERIYEKSRLFYYTVYKII